MKLNLGCGYDIRNGWVNVDMYISQGVDIVWDLNKYPYPFNGNCIDYILMSHLLEHLFEPDLALKECYRILKKEGILEIIVPYGTNYNIYHRHFFSEHSIKTGFRLTKSLQISSEHSFCFEEVEPVRVIRSMSLIEGFFKGVFGYTVNKNGTLEKKTTIH